MVTKAKQRKSAGTKKRFIGKPNGQIQERVKQCGPEHFGIVSVDCAKRRSKWMLCDFFGRVIIEPTTVEHRRGDFAAMIAYINDACQAEGLTDTIAAVEMTGIYHRPVQRAFRKAGFDTRIVHPFASSHYRTPLHPDAKTDDNDLEAIFHAAVNGYDLASLPVSEVYQSLQSLSRHRHNLVKQQARVKVQIRRIMHEAMPGYADPWEDDKLYHQSVALPIVIRFSSSEAIIKAGVDGISKHLNKSKIRFQMRTLERIVGWARTAAEPSELAAMHTRQWQDLNRLRESFYTQVRASEQEMAGFLVKTPYALLLSVTGINVVSASRLVGESGPIEHYASARAINGRAGPYPSRYQSDEVDHADGSLIRQCNRKLRGAAMRVAENLIKCHPYYRGLSGSWAQQKVDPRDRRCRIANRAMRMLFQIVSGRQLWRGKGVDREYLLWKLQEFHRTHGTPIEQSIVNMQEAFVWLPKSAYAEEAKPLSELARKKHRGAKPIADLLTPLLIQLGVEAPDELNLKTSEARSSR
ncbi:Transposase [Planctomycetes bacterium CA13]|uniref:Transposase n=1 Tax=Novipirellula herctigrandis TaxID=2527986 RepID=A0A5C5ZA41_9BACT|nr:Transposase [Planctomycetes bacterium CA13]